MAFFSLITSPDKMLKNLFSKISKPIMVIDRKMSKSVGMFLAQLILEHKSAKKIPPHIIYIKNKEIENDLNKECPSLCTC